MKAINEKKYYDPGGVVEIRDCDLAISALGSCSFFLSAQDFLLAERNGPLSRLEQGVEAGCSAGSGVVSVDLGDGARCAAAAMQRSLSAAMPVCW